MKFKTGKDIKAFRKQKGWSQAKFAEAIHITGVWVSNLETKDLVIGDTVQTKIELYRKNLT